MKAIVQERFGPPDVLQLVDTVLPEAGAGCGGQFRLGSGRVITAPFTVEASDRRSSHQ